MPFHILQIAGLKVQIGKFWQLTAASHMEIVRQLCLGRNPQLSIFSSKIRREHSKELLPLHRTSRAHILASLLIYKFRCSSSQTRRHIHYLPQLSSHNLQGSTIIVNWKDGIGCIRLMATPKKYKLTQKKKTCTECFLLDLKLSSLNCLFFYFLVYPQLEYPSTKCRIRFYLKKYYSYVTWNLGMEWRNLHRYKRSLSGMSVN